MIESALLVWTGLVAGSLHVVAGPDHLMALAPIAVNDRKRGARLGALWGVGHGLGVAALAALGIAAGHAIDISLISGWSEFAVGLTLIGIGGWSIQRATKLVVHRHDHGHDHGSAEHGHAHFHVHAGEVHDDSAHQGHTHAAMGVGFLHGTAGAGHVFGVIPALALAPADAAVYVAAYLAAAVVSMALFGGALGQIVVRGGQRLMRGLMSASGVAAIALGAVWSVSSWPL